MKKTVVALCILVVFIMMVSCDAAKKEQKITDEKTSTTMRQTTNAVKTKAKATSSDSVQNTQNDEADPALSLLEKMTLEQKAGQIFIAAFRRNSQNKPLTRLDENTAEILKGQKPGGVVFFSENIADAEQVAKLIQDFQGISDIPLFIAVDEEGGKVSRLGAQTNMGFTRMPSAEKIGSTGNPDYAYRAGAALGSELYSLGFNMNFAPVADLKTNPQNIVIGSRAFGSDPMKTGEMVAAMTAGMQQQNVSAVLKHFPGHGDTVLDTHKEEVIIEHGLDRLMSNEFIPFMYGMDAGADAVMTAHINLPNAVEENVPATLSKEVLTGILREQLCFTGLIITDALEMGAISKYMDSAEAAVRAFKAGADVLLIPHSLMEARNSIIDAVNDGTISMERLDESVLRILRTKHKRGLMEETRQCKDPEKVLGCTEHKQLVDEINKAAGKQER